MSCKWVFKVKNHKNRQVIRYKARLIAQGFLQVYRVNFRKTFASTVRRESLRMFFNHCDFIQSEAALNKCKSSIPDWRFMRKKQKDLFADFKRH